MTDDLLKAATRALREESAGSEADGQFTRARLMASLHQGKVRRRTRLAFILPLAACLAAGTAWGTVTGRLPEAFRALSEAVSPSPKAPAPSPAKKSSSNVVALPPAPPPVVAPLIEEKPAEPAPAVSAKAAPSASFRDADGDLYRLAHEQHFVNHDYARALSAWDAYLKAAPGGRLATEARYNRAICLLRLGRDAEARQALEPFAAGKTGYRQNEARELLEELSR